MEDITPQLIAGIMEAYERCAKADLELQKLLNAILNGSRSYTDALDLGDRLGAALSEAFKAGLVEGVLPDDTMYFNIADRLVMAVAGGAFDTAAAAAEAVQQRINEASGIGMKAVSAETKQGRLKDLINAVSGKDAEIARSTLTKATRQLPQGAVSDTMQANAEFQGKAGIEAKIVRRSTGKCCEWCDKAAGTYSYPDVPNDIYRRHDNCKCSVEYAPGKGGKRQTVHSGSEGKRRYVKDKYGDYGLTKEARVAHAKEMAATEAERAKNAREKRIETWRQKKLSAAQDGRQGVRDVVEKHTQAEN